MCPEIDTILVPTMYTAGIAYDIDDDWKGKENLHFDL